jgi:hypothetical protein
VATNPAEQNSNNSKRKSCIDQMAIIRNIAPGENIFAIVVVLNSSDH